MPIHLSASSVLARKFFPLLLCCCALVSALVIPGPARAQQTIYHFSPGNWGGGIDDEFGRSVVLFEAVRSQLTRLRISNFSLVCRGPKTAEYQWSVTLSLRQTNPFPFLILPDGRFDGGFEIDPQDLAYGGLEVTMQGHLQGTTGTVHLGMKSTQPDDVLCLGAARFPVAKFSQNIPHLPEPSGPGLPRIPR
ncbi:MAG: hypothetical protein C0407_06650 [Desulfobacca sp.]|nr:hypothetical protein [Desulfobacca sp.]